MKLKLIMGLMECLMMNVTSSMNYVLRDFGNVRLAVNYSVKLIGIKQVKGKMWNVVVVKGKGKVDIDG